MKEKRNIRKQFMISEELNATLKRVAGNKVTSENEIVNRALQYYLQRFNGGTNAK